jgi:hypothetical protein
VTTADLISLDYAKTSKSPDSALSRISSRTTCESDTLAGQISSLNLSNLVETVVEGIFAGHSYRRSSLSSSSPRKHSNSHDSMSITASLADIIIIISIEWQDSWVFQSHAGGWKRILMNIFGNSLKYTDSGFVHVSLRINKMPTTESPSRAIVALDVEDSGKGMSKDYLKHRLYCPFAQEDPLSVGTGLGLSIVRQLVTELGGAIAIQSEVGYGTTVQVTAPVEPSSETTEALFPDSSSMLSAVKARCGDHTLCFVGFHDSESTDEEVEETRKRPPRRVRTLKSSLATYAVDWFGMNVTEASSLGSAKGDILLGLQSKVDLSTWLADTSPLLIFEDDPLNTQLRDAKGITVLSQPQVFPPPLEF